MAIETRASSASKVEESRNSRILRSSLPSGSGLRRSAREKSLKSDTKSSRLNAGKSGRIEKQTLTPTGVRRKHETIVRNRTVGPSTRSEKSKGKSLLGSSRLKKPICLGLPIVVEGQRKVESMVQLTSETNSEVELSKVKTRYSARSYKALLKKKEKKKEKKKQRSNVEANSESPTTSKTVDGLSRDASASDHEQPVHGDDIVLEAASANEIVSVSIDNSRVSKRKRTEAGSVNETALVSNKEADISPTDAATVEDQSQVDRLSSDCAEALKRQRVNDEGKQQELCYLNKLSDWDDARHKSKVDGSQGSGGALHLACNPSEVEEVIINKSIERNRPQNSQNNLHCDLKPKIASLCEVLTFPDDVKCTVVSFLEYVMSNQYHQVASKPDTKLQAFQIALCWTAASLLKYKIDHMESLGLAKEQLNFGCKKDEADYEYSMLRCLKKLFQLRHPLSKCVSEDQLHASPSRSILLSPQKNGDGIQIPAASQELLSSSALQQPLGLVHQDFSRSIKDINKKCDKKLRKLLEQQGKHREDLLRKYEDQKAELKQKREVEAAVIRLYSSDSVKPDKLKFLKAEYAEKIEKLEHERVTELKNLEAMQSATRKNVEERKLKWVEGLESWAKEELMPRLPQKDTGQTSGTGVSSDVHPKQVTGQQSTHNRDVPSNVCLSDHREETTQMVKSAAEVLHKTPSTVHVESTHVEVTSEPLASTGARVDEQGGEILSAESERPVTDQQVKDSSLQSQDEESGTRCREKAGLGVTNLPHGVDAGLRGDLVSAIPETATTTCLVDDNADGVIEEGEVAGVEEGVGEILSAESERPVTDQRVKDSSLQSQDEESGTTGREKVGLEVPNLPHDVDAGPQDELVSAVPETATTTGLVDNDADGEIEDGEITGAEEGRDFPAEEVPDMCLEVSVDSTVATAQDDAGITGTAMVLDKVTAVGDSFGVVNGVSANQLDDQNDGCTKQDVAASVPSEKDGSKELSATDSPLIQLETSITGVSSSRTDQEDAGILAGVSNVRTELADGSSLPGKDVEVNTAGTDGHKLSDEENSPCVGGEVGHQEGTLTGVHEEATPEVVGVGASVEVVDSHNDGMLMHDATAPVTNQSDQSQQIVHTNATPVQDDVISVVPGSGTNTEVVDVADLCIENNGTGIGRESRSSEDTEVHHQDDQSQQIVQTNSISIKDGIIPSVPDSGTTTEVVDADLFCRENIVPSTGVGQECGSSENTAVHHQDATAIPLVPEAATTARVDMGNSCTESNVSSQLDVGSERVSVQNLAASTASRTDGSGENSRTNLTSMQPEVAVSALPNQPPASTRANVLETVTVPSASANCINLQQPPASTRANVLETVTVPSASANRARVLQPAPVYRMPLPLGNDPLQNELDRVSREVDQIVSLHEKEKLQLRFDCEKEIEEVVAQICRKYEAIAREKETEFARSKLELDTKHNKLLMNKFLADTFRSKCVDSRACNSGGVLQDAAASFMQQFQNLSPQPYTGQRFSTAASLPLQPPPQSNRQPNGLAANHQITCSPHPSISRAHPFAHRFPAPPPIPQLSRPLNISTLTPTPSSNLHQFSSQFRAPAPHLQAFRAAATTAPNSSSHGLQSQLRPSSTPPASVNAPAVVTPRPSHSSAMDTRMDVDVRRPSSSVQQQEVRLNGPPRPSHSSVMDTRMDVDVRRPSSSVQQQEVRPNGPPRPSHSSAMDTRMDVDVRRPSSSVQQQEVRPNGPSHPSHSSAMDTRMDVDVRRPSSSVQQQEVRLNGTEGNPTQRNEVVCLSDDD